ncbi:MAG: hypothetical protein KAU03_06625, partial [Candidatus Altiarchaeales archaeon]|nr:hypothetical protein [Candidatus Altiarchaeales archaeon]
MAVWARGFVIIVGPLIITALVMMCIVIVSVRATLCRMECVFLLGALGSMNQMYLQRTAVLE